MKPEQMNRPIHFIDSPEFHEPNARGVIMVEPPPRPPERVHHPAASLITRMSLPTFTRFEQRFYFRRMNFLLCQAEQLRKELVGNISNKSADSVVEAFPQQIDRLLADASAIRHLIVRANLPLIPHMIRGRRLTDERISDAILILIRCLDKFNYSWGLSFSTYVSQSVKHRGKMTFKTKMFERAVRAGRVMVDGAIKDRVAESPDYRFPAPDCTVIHQDNRRIVANAMRSLLPKWKEVMERRYGLAGREEQNATDIANDVGVTRSRIGQIEQRAHRDLRQRLSRFVTAEAK